MEEDGEARILAAVVRSLQALPLRVALEEVDPEEEAPLHATWHTWARQALPVRVTREEADLFPLTSPEAEEAHLAQDPMLQVATLARVGMVRLSALPVPVLCFQVVVADRLMTTSTREHLEEQGVAELVEEFLGLLAAQTPEVVVAERLQHTTLQREEAVAALVL